MRALFVVLATVAVLGAPAVVGAQVGTTTDILTGVVADSSGRVLEGAIVEATSVQTELTRKAQTNDKGRWTIVFPDGGGQYTLVIRYVGMAPARMTLARQADEDRLVANVRLSTIAQQLQAVVVRGQNRRPRGNDRAGAGSRETDIPSDRAARLPVDASDLMALATLAPGVVGIDATDSTDAAFSVAGLRPTENSVTLDGLSFGSGSVPQDAVRTTRVVTSTYDVARGGFSGGLVASTTQGGTNTPQGSFTYTLRDRSLAWGVADSLFPQAFSQNQLGGGFGGPIVRNKLFVFGALQGRWRTNQMSTLLDARGPVLTRIGVSPDSVSRFLSLVNGAGISPTAPVLSPDQAADNYVGLLRLDYLVSDRNTLMLRGDWRRITQDPTRVSSSALPQTGGSSATSGGGIMAVLTSYIGDRYINELRAYYSQDRRSASPVLDLPEGRVQVASDLSGDTRAVSTLSFGGNPSLPQSTHNSSFETTDELSWLQGAAHRVKLGVYFNATRYLQDVTSNQNGVFTYPSLDALEEGRPSLFTRTLAPTERAGTTVNTALYLGDSWRHGPALQLTYGARLEASSETGAPPFNGLVDSLFAMRTDRFPHDVQVSPRLGFTWIPGAAQGVAASTIIRGGIGAFRSPAPSGLFAAAQGATGLAGAELQLVCVGSDVPTPDWVSYASDPSSIPTTCASSDLGGASDSARAALSAHPNAFVFDPAFKAPSAWRASLGVQRRVLGRLGVSLDASWARGVNQYGFADLNLDTVPKFRLADEGNRPVYVSPDNIDAASGALGSSSSRLHPELGDVMEISSNLYSESHQLTLSLNGFTDKGMFYSLSYTYTHARDESSFSCCSPLQGLSSLTTAGNPNTPEWATSNFQRTHSFIGTVTYPVTSALELTAIGRFSSGTPFTPLVGSDINGDGARNDRAFVFAPAAADPAVASAMQQLLASAPSSVRQCLQSQEGAVAARNSCTGPWQPSFDMQLNFRPNVLGLQRRLTLSIVTVNLISGIDNLVHGANNAHGWGAARFPDATLLYVHGFDPSTETFDYTVNERFGSTSGSLGALRMPFQIGFQGHLAVGPARLGGLFGGGGGRRGGGGPGGDGGPGTAGDFLSRFASALPNPVASIIGMKDTLQLTSDQVTRLQPLADTIAVHNDSVAAEIRSRVDKAGTNPDLRVLLATLRPRLTEARDVRTRAMKEVQKILTPAQWARVPNNLKSGGGFGGGGGRGRGP